MMQHGAGGGGGGGGAGLRFRAGSRRHLDSRTGFMNPTYQNHCFLNVILQSFWHLDAVRNVLLQIQDHACGEIEGLGPRSGCLLCALRDTLYTYACAPTSSSVNPLRIRTALAHVSKDKFPLGDRADPSEVIHFLLKTFHEAQSPFQDASNPAVCECIAHKLFWCEFLEQTICTCGATHDPIPHDFFSCGLTVYATDLLKFGRFCRRDGPPTFDDRTMITALRMAVQRLGGTSFVEQSSGDERTWSCSKCGVSCPSRSLYCPNCSTLRRRTVAVNERTWECGTLGCQGTTRIARYLLNSPPIFIVNVVFASNRIDKHDVEQLLNLCSDSIVLPDLFEPSTERTSTEQHYFTGMVCFALSHYVSFFHDYSAKVWVLFDDSRIDQLDSFVDVIEMCKRREYMPVMLYFCSDHPLAGPVMTLDDAKAMYRKTMERMNARGEFRSVPLLMPRGGAGAPHSQQSGGSPSGTGAGSGPPTNIRAGAPGPGAPVAAPSLSAGISPIVTSCHATSYTPSSMACSSPVTESSGSHCSGTAIGGPRFVASTSTFSETGASHRPGYGAGSGSGGAPAYSSSAGLAGSMTLPARASTSPSCVAPPAFEHLHSTAPVRSAHPAAGRTQGGPQTYPPARGHRITDSMLAAQMQGYDPHVSRAGAAEEDPALQDAITRSYRGPSPPHPAEAPPGSTVPTASMKNPGLRVAAVLGGDHLSMKEFPCPGSSDCEASDKLHTHAQVQLRGGRILVAVEDTRLMLDPRCFECSTAEEAVLYHQDRACPRCGQFRSDSRLRNLERSLRARAAVIEYFRTKDVLSGVKSLRLTVTKRVQWPHSTLP